MRDLLQEELLQTIVDGLSNPDSSEFKLVLDILRARTASEVGLLFETLLDDPDAGLALGVARAVGHLECREAVGLLTALVDEPGKWFSHADRAAIRLAAVESLGLVAHSDGVDALLGLLDSTGEEELRLEAVRALGRIGSESSVMPLMARMKAHPTIALSAAGALAQIGGEEAFRGLLAGLESKEEMIRSASVWALGKMGDGRAVGPLTGLVRHSDPFLRRDIAWALGHIGGLPARLALGAMCQMDPDLGVRREAARAIRSGAVLGQCGEDVVE